MPKHKKKFLLPSDRAELLKAIEQGDIIEQVAQPVIVPPTLTKVIDSEAALTRGATRDFSEPMPARLETHDTETTAYELRRIFTTVVVLVVLLGSLTVIQIKTPYINQLAEKIGSVLSI